MFEIIPNWHPVFVHFTVSTLSMASISYFVSYVLVLRDNPKHTLLKHFADWNLSLGAIFTVITVSAGWLAFNSVAHDTPSHEAMTIHRNWALGTSTLFIIIAVWIFYKKRSYTKVTISLITFIIIGIFMLGSTAWRGGETVYRYGLGVLSLPKVEAGSDGHDHAHGDENIHTEMDSKANNPGMSIPQTQGPDKQGNGGGHANHQH